MQGIGLPGSYGPPRSDPLNRASRAAAHVRFGPMARLRRLMRAPALPPPPAASRASRGGLLQCFAEVLAAGGVGPAAVDDVFSAGILHPQLSRRWRPRLFLMRQLEGGTVARSLGLPALRDSARSRGRGGRLCCDPSRPLNGYSKPASQSVSRQGR